MFGLRRPDTTPEATDRLNFGVEMGKTLFSYDVSPEFCTTTENGSTFAEQPFDEKQFPAAIQLASLHQGLTYESPEQHGREKL